MYELSDWTETLTPIYSDLLVISLFVVYGTSGEYYHDRTFASRRRVKWRSIKFNEQLTHCQSYSIWKEEKRVRSNCDELI